MDIITIKNNGIRIEKPIFVVGCCNSGTTILQRSLLSHPNLSGPQTEGQDLKDLPSCIKQFIGRQTFRLWATPQFGKAYYLTEDDYERKTAERIAAVYEDQIEQGTRLVEKSPPNTLRMRFLQSIFPDAFFVIIVRNGIAVSEGIRRKRLLDPDRQHMEGLRTTIDDAAKQWYYANSILLNDRLHLRNSIVIKYEDLVTDTSRVLSSILNFCECDITRFKMPEFESDHNTKQINRLTTKEIKTIYGITNGLLAKLQYQLPRNEAIDA